MEKKDEKIKQKREKRKRKKKRKRKNKKKLINKTKLNKSKRGYWKHKDRQTLRLERLILFIYS